LILQIVSAESMRTKKSSFPRNLHANLQLKLMGVPWVDEDKDKS